eukprot:2226942-Pyramimonas_sp.AAC.1
MDARFTLLTPLPLRPECPVLRRGANEGVWEHLVYTDGSRLANASPQSSGVENGPWPSWAPAGSPPRSCRGPCLGAKRCLAIRCARSRLHTTAS